MELDMNQATDKIGALMDTADQTDSSTEVEEAVTPEIEEVEAPEVSGEDGEPDDGDEKPELKAEKAKFKVKVQGEELDVELDELVNGYQRQADYTRKTQELAAKQKEIESSPVPEQFKQRLATYERLLGNAVAQDQNKDWVQLAKDDPATYVMEMAEAQARAQEFQRISENQKLEQKQNLEKVQKVQMEELLTKLPAWKDQKVFADESVKVTNYLQSLGASPEEVSQLIDHRIIVLADKARRYDELMAAKPEVTKKIEKLPPKVERPGTKSGNNGGKFNDTFAKLKKSGSLEDAFAALDQLTS
jgi:hypothetical protein